MSRGERDLIVLTLAGASCASVLGIEARRIARPFCLPRLTRDRSLLPVIVSPQHAIPRRPPSLSASTRNKKKPRQKKQACIAMVQIHLWVIACHRSSLLCAPSGSKSGWALTYDLAHINYSPWPPRRVIKQYFRVIPFSQPLLLLFQIISRHDHLLRHSRCRQLPHPSESQPQTTRRPCMRHLWGHRATHNQVPPLWWLCTSLYCLFALWPEH